MYKKLSFILFCLIFLVSISCVVAEENIETNSSTIIAVEYNCNNEIDVNEYSNEQIESNI